MKQRTCKVGSDTFFYATLTHNLWIYFYIWKWNGKTHHRKGSSSDKAWQKIHLEISFCVSCPRRHKIMWARCTGLQSIDGCAISPAVYFTHKKIFWTTGVTHVTFADLSLIAWMGKCTNITVQYFFHYFVKGSRVNHSVIMGRMHLCACFHPFNFRWPHRTCYL